MNSERSSVEATGLDMQGLNCSCAVRAQFPKLKDESGTPVSKIEIILNKIKPFKKLSSRTKYATGQEQHLQNVHAKINVCMYVCMYVLYIYLYACVHFYIEK